MPADLRFFSFAAVHLRTHCVPVRAYDPFTPTDWPLPRPPAPSPPSTRPASLCFLYISILKRIFRPPILFMKIFRTRVRGRLRRMRVIQTLKGFCCCSFSRAVPGGFCSSAGPISCSPPPQPSPPLPLPPPRPTLRPSSPLHSLLAQPPPLRSLPLRPMQWFFTPRAVPSSPRGPASIPRLGDQATLRRLPVHLVEPARGKGRAER